jgi:RNA polymerase sigma-54 factor
MTRVADADAPPETLTLAAEAEDHWDRDAEPWQERIGPSSDRDGNDEMEHPAVAESLRDHLLWQLHLGHFSQRDTNIGIALIDAIDDDGYLREDLSKNWRAACCPDIDAGLDEFLQVLHRIQQFDPVGIGARDLGECLRLQLRALPTTPRARRRGAADRDRRPLERLPKIGIDGVCQELRCDRGEVGIGGAPAAQRWTRAPARSTANWGRHLRHPGLRDLAPAGAVAGRTGRRQAMPRVAIQRGYEQMIRTPATAMPITCAVACRKRAGC